MTHVFVLVVFMGIGEDRKVISDDIEFANLAHCLVYADLIVKRFGVEKGTMLMRKYACCYAQGRRGARQFRSKAACVSSPTEFFDTVENFFPTDDPPADSK